MRGNGIRRSGRIPAQAAGFDYYLGLPYSDDRYYATGQRIGERLRGNQWPFLPWMENDKVIEAPANRNLMTQRETNAALKFIAANKNKPSSSICHTTCPAARASRLPARPFVANPRTARGAMRWRNSTGPPVDFCRTGKT